MNYFVTVFGGGSGWSAENGTTSAPDTMSACPFTLPL
jgi:hypothetical protein